MKTIVQKPFMIKIIKLTQKFGQLTFLNINYLRLYIKYSYQLLYRLIGLVARVFANGQGELSSVDNFTCLFLLAKNHYLASRNDLCSIIIICFYTVIILSNKYHFRQIFLPIDGILTSITILSQSGPGSNGFIGVHHAHQISTIRDPQSDEI